MHRRRVNEAAVRDMLGRGMRQSQVARALGFSDNAISVARARWGIAYVPRPGPRPSVPRETFTDLWARHTPQEVSERTGCTVRSVKDRARRLGLGKGAL